MKQASLIGNGYQLRRTNPRLSVWRHTVLASMIILLGTSGIWFVIPTSLGAAAYRPAASAMLRSSLQSPPHQTLPRLNAFREGEHYSSTAGDVAEERVAQVIRPSPFLFAGAFRGTVPLNLGPTAFGFYSPEEEISSPTMPGQVNGTGTHFEIHDSQYLNVALDSSEPITLVLESVPEMVEMYIESASGGTSAIITLSGFTASSVFHKYEDDYANHAAFTTDAQGGYTYTQDLSGPHFVYIQPTESTKIVLDDATGGDCQPAVGPIGIWDSPTKTCTLTTNLAEAIQIDDNGITLDGNGHTITGSLTGFGVLVSEKTGVTIKNLIVSQFVDGIRLVLSNDNTISGNTASSNTRRGIALVFSNGNTVSGNTANFNFFDGIFLNDSGGNTLSANTATSNTRRGIFLRFFDAPPFTGSNSNILASNVATSNAEDGILVFGSSNNSLVSNTASFNDIFGIALGGINNDLTGNIANANGVDGIAVASDGSTLTGNTVDANVWHGISLIGSGSNSIIGNTATNNAFGILLWYSSNGNILEGNFVSSNLSAGIILQSSSDNTLRYNTIHNNQFGGMVLTLGANNNVIYNNNFIDNLMGSGQSFVSADSSGNLFNLPAPTGGNYWSNFDTAPEGCENLDADNFCDSPYFFGGSQDDLPWTRQNGWLDSTPPSILKSIPGTPQYSDGVNLYVTSATTIRVSVSDAESGVQSCTISVTGPAGTTNPACGAGDNDFTISGPDGTYTITATAVDNVGNIATDPLIVILDNSPPTISINAPAGTYILNQPGITANYGCDDDSGSGVASCTGTLANGASVDTGISALGYHLFTVTAADNLGNSAFNTVSYQIAYSLTCGRTVLSPLEQVSSPLALTKTYKAGNTLPIKFQLCDFGGVFIATAEATLAVYRVSNGVDNGDPVVVLDSGASNDNGNIFRYDPDAQQYILNLSTKNLSTGTYKLVITLDDGTTIVTYFQLK